MKTIKELIRESLTEVAATKDIRRQESIKNTSLNDAQLNTWDEVVEFQKLHKYKFAWCLHYADSHDIPIPSNYDYMRRIIGV